MASLLQLYPLNRLLLAVMFDTLLRAFRRMMSGMRVMPRHKVGMMRRLQRAQSSH